MRFTHKLLVTVVAAVASGLAVRAVVRGRRRIDLDGKVVLLTGGSRGLGLELGRQLCEQGVRLAICARDEGELRAAADDLRGRGCGDVFTGVCDVTDAAQVERFVGRVREALGPVDVLINNAGMITVGPFESLGSDDFEEAFATHVGGPLHFLRAVLPDMKRRGGGRIVNVASVGGKLPIPHMSAYVASKHALVGLSETVRAELIRHGVYLTLVCPGVVRTGSPWHARFKGPVEDEFAWFAGVDNLRGVAIATGAMAAKIIDALRHGDAELVAPLNAKLAASFHGAFGGVSTELAGLQARLMPTGGGVGRDDAAVPGRVADVGQLPGFLAEEQRENAAKFNEGPGAS